MTEYSTERAMQLCLAFQERADYEMSRLIENIMDVNTDATAKRKLTITLELIPDANRQNIAVKCNVKSALAPISPVVTMLYAAAEDILAGKAFRIILMDALNDNNSPVWVLDKTESSVMIDLSELARRLREE